MLLTLEVPRARFESAQTRIPNALRFVMPMVPYISKVFDVEL